MTTPAFMSAMAPLQGREVQEFKITSNEFVERIMNSTKEFDIDTMTGVKWFLNKALGESNSIMGLPVSSKGVNGPGLNFHDMTQRVIVPLLKISTGRMLNDRQSECLRSLLTLVSCQLVPQSDRMGRARFTMTHERTDQRVATIGSARTINGGVGTNSYSITLDLTTMVVTETINSIEVFTCSDPNETARRLTAILNSMATAWDLTVIAKHARFLAHQPTLMEMMMRRTGHMAAHSELGTIISGVQLETLVTGSLNRDSSHFRELILGGLNEMRMPGDKAVIVVTAKAWQSCLSKECRTVVVTESPKQFMYTTLTPDAIKGHELIGRIIPVDAVSQHRVESVRAPVGTGAEGSGPIDKFSQRPPGGALELPGLDLGGGVVAPIIVLDDTPFSESSDANVASSFINDGMMRVFMTVGSAPEFYKTLPVAGLMNKSDRGDVSSKAVAMRQPNTTFFINHDRGNRQESVTTSQIHRAVARSVEDLFDFEAATERFETLGLNTVGKFSEEEGADLFLVEDSSEKLTSLQCVFEGSPRFMLCEIGIAASDDVDVSGIIMRRDTDAVVCKPRVCMGNASPMNMHWAEAVGVGCSLSEYCPLSDDLSKFYALVSLALGDTGPQGADDLIAIRGSTGAVSEAIINRIVSAMGAHLAMSDPYCQVMIIKTLERMVHLDAWELKGKGTLLLSVLRGGRDGVMSTWSKLFEDADYNVLHKMNGTGVIAVPSLGSFYDRYMRIMTCCVLPVFTDRVVRASSASGSSVLFDTNRVSGGEGLAIAAFYDVYFVGSGGGGGGQSHSFMDSPTDVFQNLYREVFQRRAGLVRKNFHSSPHTGVLLMMHYHSRINASTMIKFTDRTYYSGSAYILIRTLRFAGHGITVMPKQACHFITGNKYVHYPVQNPGNTVYNQLLEMEIAPGGMDMLGVHIPNAWCADTKGYNNTLNFDDPDTMLVFDSYNGFTPESRSTSTDTLSILPLLGRFNMQMNSPDPVLHADPFTGRFTELPTMIPQTSEMLAFYRSKVGSGRGNIYDLMEAFDGSEFVETLPIQMRSRVDDAASVLTRTLPEDTHKRNIFSGNLGIMLADNYVIGQNGDMQLKGDFSLTTADIKLNPKILNHGLIGDKMYGTRNYNFLSAFSQYTSAKLSAYSNGIGV